MHDTDTGKRLRKLRRERELTATDVARQANITRQYLHLIEAGRHDPSEAVRQGLARALGVKVDEVWPREKTGGSAA
jgi:transcriptional regulator with XRE-family HTH domain